MKNTIQMGDGASGGRRRPGRQGSVLESLGAGDLKIAAFPARAARKVRPAVPPPATAVAAAKRGLTIGYLLNRFPPPGQRSVLDEILALGRFGVDVHVFVLQSGTGSIDEATLGVEAGGAGDPLPVPVVTDDEGRGTTGKIHRQAQWIAREVAAKQIGHLHAEYAAAEVTRQVKALTGVSYSLAATGNEILQNDRDTRSLRQTVDEAEFVIAPSNISWKRLLTASDPSAARKVLRMHPGVDLERVEFHPETGRDPNSILAVAPLERGSGLGHLVDAIAVLRDRRRITTRLTIVGEGELEHELRARIEALGLGDRITMLPRVGAGRLLSLMRAHAVMALPYETAPGPDRGAVPPVLLQAMAVGLPVVSTQVAGVTEVVEDGWTGRLVDPQDSQWLAGALETLLDNLRLRVRMAKDARLVVERRFALSQNVSLLASLFASAAGQTNVGNAALAAHP